MICLPGDGLLESRWGPVKDIPIEPNGAVTRIESTAIVNTWAPLCKSSGNGFADLRTMSRASGASAAFKIK